MMFQSILKYYRFSYQRNRQQCFKFFTKNECGNYCVPAGFSPTPLSNLLKISSETPLYVWLLFTVDILVNYKDGRHLFESHSFCGVSHLLSLFWKGLSAKTPLGHKNKLDRFIHLQLFRLRKQIWI